MKITLSELKQMVRQELRNTNASSRTSRNSRTRRLSESPARVRTFEDAVSKHVDLYDLDEDRLELSWEDVQHIMADVSRLSPTEKDRCASALAEGIKKMYEEDTFLRGSTYQFRTELDDEY